RSRDQTAELAFVGLESKRAKIPLRPRPIALDATSGTDIDEDQRVPAELCVETGMNENVHGWRRSRRATVHHGTPGGTRQLSAHSRVCPAHRANSREISSLSVDALRPHPYTARR